MSEDEKGSESMITIKFWAIVLVFAAVTAFLVTSVNSNTGRIVRLETAMESMQLTSGEIKAMISEVRTDIKNHIIDYSRRERDRAGHK